MRPELFRPMASFQDRGPSITLTGFAVTRDARIRSPSTPGRSATNYNVLDNHSGASELWLRSGFQWDITNNVSAQEPGLRATTLTAIGSTTRSIRSTTVPPAQVGQSLSRTSSVDHDQKLYGNITDLTINSNIGGMDNRFVATVAASSLQFNVVAGRFLQHDYRQSGEPGSRPLWPRSRQEILYSRRQCLAVVRGPPEADVEIRSDRRHPRSRISSCPAPRFDVDGDLRSDAGYPFSTTFSP